MQKEEQYKNMAVDMFHFLKQYVCEDYSIVEAAHTDKDPNDEESGRRKRKRKLFNDETTFNEIYLLRTY